ncbi:MAG: oligosaccharide flippase family protein [Paracoccaceae bacterium]|nr:oligosaccharide flippase family protein [Paracoccaceae bacterium]
MFKRSLPKTGFVGQLLSYAASEVAGKASRLVVVVVVARMMDAEAIGIAAAALAAGDILKSFTENGAGQRIILAAEDTLAQTCNTAHRIFWGWCLGLFIIQSAIAAKLLISGYETSGWLLAILALEYLFMPAGLVQAALAMREGKLHQTAVISGAQVVGANLTTAALALLWASPFAMIVPRVIAAPVWLVLMRRLRPWHARPDQGFCRVAPFWSYGWAVVGIEVVKVARLQADKLVVGALLGAEVLGYYFMAFNAGLGLATSFAQAFSVVLFPYLCAAQDRLGALRDGLANCILLLAPIVVLQALLAPFYVPLLLGPDWQAVSHVVSVLCLAALPAVLWSATSGWCRAEGRPATELGVNCLLTASLTLNAAVLAPFGLMAVASGYLVISTVIMLGASLWLLPAQTFSLRRST